MGICYEKEACGPARTCARAPGLESDQASFVVHFFHMFFIIFKFVFTAVFVVTQKQIERIYMVEVVDSITPVLYPYVLSEQFGKGVNYQMFFLMLPFHPEQKLVSFG